jgi:aminoglycoside phosphotransferase (APT) family kinase protein
MMIELSEDGSVSDRILAIIDWQTMFAGSPCFDLARFIVTCSDAEIRRGCEYQVVDFYFDYLTKRYKEHGKTPKFTREQAYELYELAFVQETLLFGIMVRVYCFNTNNNQF